MKLAVAIVHGMGRDKRGFSHHLQRGIAKAYQQQGMQHQWNDIYFQEVFWADLLTDTQVTLYQRLTNNHSLRYKRLRRFFIEYLGDVLAYEGGEQYRQAIHQRMQESLASFLPLYEAHRDCPLIVIGHSLGSIIALDFLKQHGAPFLSHLCGIVTLGSPLALWSLQDKDYGQPLTFPGESLSSTHQSLARWINIYDKDDVIAYPLKPINAHFNQSVSEDIQINVGGPFTSWNPFSHQGYWQNREVHRVIATLLLALTD